MTEDMGGKTNMRFLAPGISKTQVNDLHVAFFYRFKYVCYRHCSLLRWEVSAKDFRRGTVSAGTMPTRKTIKSYNSQTFRAYAIRGCAPIESVTPIGARNWCMAWLFARE